MGLTNVDSVEQGQLINFEPPPTHERIQHPEYPAVGRLVTKQKRVQIHE